MENTGFYSYPSDSLGHRRKHFRGLPIISMETLHSIRDDRNPSDSDGYNLGPTIKPKHDFHTSSENRSLRWNPLDSIRVHRNPQGTDGRIHVINFLTSGVFNHYHFR